jgi:hypothetical protein
MSQPLKLDPGRVDHLALGLLKRRLKEVKNPFVQFACKMMEPEIKEVLQEELGPGTQAHKIGQRIIRAVEDKD